jgi:Asp-tRNA(Asn)/Glu-tRNA(Gln) amidotransferase A subunit family amidase
MPNGFGPNGLPTSVALLGTAWSEAALASLGARYQRATDFHRKRPPLVRESTR